MSKNKGLKTIGILGGMGPLATATLFNNIILNTSANKDQEHIPILIHNNTKISDRTAYILDDEKENPKSELIKSAKILEEGGADFIIMPCNTAHFFYEDIQKEVKIPVINMIKEAISQIQENDLGKKVGLLSTDGTIKARVYHNLLEKENMEVVVPSKENQKHVMNLIYNIKEDIKQDNLDGFYMAIKEMEDEGVDIIISGCTEVSVALDMYNIRGNFIDPMKVLMETSILKAGAKLK